LNLKAIVSGYIYKNEKSEKDIEILTQVDNDENDTEAFCGIADALLDKIDTGDREDYYYMAIVEAKLVTHRGIDYTEYDTEYYVNEIKSIEDISA